MRAGCGGAGGSSRAATVTGRQTLLSSTAVAVTAVSSLGEEATGQPWRRHSYLLQCWQAVSPRSLASSVDIDS